MDNWQQTSFFVPGEPVALKRHRHGRFGNYDPSKNDKADFLAKAMAMLHRPAEPLDMPLSVKIKAYFTRPKSHYGTGKNSGKLKQTAPKYHTGRPDADNIGKFVLDALSSVYWRDDACIADLHVTKVYGPVATAVGDMPGVNIEIRRLKEDGKG